MMGKLQRSWELVKASWAVLQADKELVVFPIVSFIGSILVLITFAIPMLAAGFFDSFSREGPGIVSLIVAFLFYVVTYTVTFFANTALVGAAMIRLKGGDPTLSDGFRIAQQRFGHIIGYALISATVGMILRALSERGGLVGQIVSSVLGFTWSVATFLVVPVLVVEDIGPVDAIKKSADLLKRTWGEQLIANFGMGTVFGLAMFGIILLGVVLIGVAASISDGLAILMVLGLIIAVLVVGLIASTLTGIYQAALYRYATEGDAGSYFTYDMIHDAFKPKR